LPVKSRADIDALDTILDTEISGGNLLARVGLAPPASLEVIDQDVYFSYGRWNKANHARSWSLQYQEWVATLGGRQPSLHEAREDKIHVADAATGLRRTSIKVKDALSFDTVRTDGHYLIFSGNWYRASPNLNNKLNAFLGQLQASAFPPPQWDGVSDEGSYNVAACNSTPSLIHMDARNVFYGPGQSKFEFCDFLDPTNKILYFVKNPSSSAGMSHLYEQARRTAELFFGSNPDYIDKLRVALLRGRPTLDVSWLSTYSRSLDWEICLVSMGRAASSLPMFAKCGLMRVHRELASRFRAVTYCVA